MSRPFIALLAALATIGCNDLLSNSEPGEIIGEGGAAADDDDAEGAGAPLPEGGSGGNEASVITWNLENFPLYEDTFSRTVDLVQTLEPDVLAIQEIADPSAFYDLVDALPDYKGVLNDDQGAYLRLGLIYRHERVSVTAVQTLFEDDWYPFPRPPLKAHVVITGESSIDFDLVVVHQKAQIDSESQARRLAGSEELDGWLRERLSTGDEQDFMVLGDFNDHLLDPPAANVFTPFLDQPERYRFLTMPLEQAGAFSYIPFEAMIDHVLVTADMTDEIGTGETEVLALDESVASYGVLSDHRPVRTWLRW
jgi:endonuclease/exonuclease/phosphatase family metal-dependent hydrolase